MTQNEGKKISTGTPRSKELLTDRKIYSLAFFTVLSASLLILSYKILQPFWSAILLGSILALLGVPLQFYLVKKGWNNTICAVVVTMVIVSAIAIPLTLFAVEIVREGQGYMEALDKGELVAIIGYDLDTFVEYVKAFTVKYVGVGLTESIPWNKASSLVHHATEGFFALLLKAVSGLPKTFLTFALAVLILFFLIRDGDRLINWIGMRVPMERQSFDAVIAKGYSATMSATLGSFWAAFAQSALIGIGFTLLSVPGVLISIGVAFFLSWVPFVGVTPVLAYGFIYLGSQGHWVEFFVLVGFGIVIGIIDNIIRTLVTSHHCGTHPMITLLAILGGINMFGILGVIIGPVFVEIAIAFADRFKRERDSIVL